MSKVWGNETGSGSCSQVTGLGLRADGLSSDRQRPALHLSSSQINNRRKQWATTARRDWVSESRYSKCNAIYQCHSRQSMLAKHTANTHSTHIHIMTTGNKQGHTLHKRCRSWHWAVFAKKQDQTGLNWFSPRFYIPMHLRFFKFHAAIKTLTIKVKNVLLQRAQLRKTSGNRKWRENRGENSNVLLIMQSLGLKKKV